jgi:hypothetical protein
MGTNEQVVQAVVENQATSAILAQVQEKHMYELFAVKVSWQGINVDYMEPELAYGADRAEAERNFASGKNLASDTVGKWAIKGDIVA